MTGSGKMKEQDLRGQVWFVTGASAGFGQTIAEEVLERGGQVVATARRRQALTFLEGKAPDRVALSELDVATSAGLEEALSLARSRFGRVDVLVNNAGRGFTAGVEEGSDAEVRDLFDVNFFGLASVTRAVLPIMRAQGAGKIINISSTVGQKGIPSAGYYCASKWAVEGLSEALALEAAPLGIKVLIVEPGPFRTDFSGRSMVEAQQRVDAYEVVTAARQWAQKFDGVQPGDPVRAAKLIVDAAQDPDPPLRLVLGRMAYEGVTQALAQRVADIQRSSAIAPTADFDA